MSRSRSVRPLSLSLSFRGITIRASRERIKIHWLGRPVSPARECYRKYLRPYSVVSTSPPWTIRKNWCSPRLNIRTSFGFGGFVFWGESYGYLVRISAIISRGGGGFLRYLCATSGWERDIGESIGFRGSEINKTVVLPAILHTYMIPAFPVGFANKEVDVATREILPSRVAAPKIRVSARPLAALLLASLGSHIVVVVQLAPIQSPNVSVTGLRLCARQRFSSVFSETRRLGPGRRQNKRDSSDQSPFLSFFFFFFVRQERKRRAL